MNKIEFVTEGELEYIRKLKNESGDIFEVEIDGAQIANRQDYLSFMSKELKFPIFSEGFDSYNDWMCDLEWIEQDCIMLIFKNVDQFLKRDYHAKEIIFSNLCISILPYWKADVIKNCVGGAPRNFVVYIVI
ncbi:barstar family protein [Roseburia hominis]